MLKVAAPTTKRCISIPVEERAAAFLVVAVVKDPHTGKTESIDYAINRGSHEVALLESFMDGMSAMLAPGTPAVVIQQL